MFFLIPEAWFPVPMASVPPGMCGTIFVPFRAAAVAIDYLFLVPNVYFCSFLAPRIPTRPHSFSVCVCCSTHLLVRVHVIVSLRYTSTQTELGVYGPVLTSMGVSVFCVPHEL